MKIKSFSCDTFSTGTRSKEANGYSEVEVKSTCICMCQAANMANTYSSFCSMWLEVFLLPPGSDASPSLGYTQHLIYQYLFIHLSGYWGTACDFTIHEQKGSNEGLKFPVWDLQSQEFNMAKVHVAATSSLASSTLTLTLLNLLLEQSTCKLKNKEKKKKSNISNWSRK